MDNYESIHKLSKHSGNFYKFNRYDIFSIPIVLYDFTMVYFNEFHINLPCFSVLNDFRVLYT